jgi:hypothetical protein
MNHLPRFALLRAITQLFPPVQSTMWPLLAGQSAFLSRLEQAGPPACCQKGSEYSGRASAVLGSESGDDRGHLLQRSIGWTG